MLLSDEEIQERITSPNNLLNRLRRATAPIPTLPGATLPPTTKDLDIDVDSKLAVTRIRDKAASIMASALDELSVRIPNVEKPEKLAAIAAEMNKVLIARQDDDKVKQSQIIVYAPQVIQETHFDTIVATNEE